VAEVACRKHLNIKLNLIIREASTVTEGKYKDQQKCNEAMQRKINKRSDAEVIVVVKEEKDLR
jgi:hypothetical protein